MTEFRNIPGMKPKTIKKVLQEKFSDFTESIKDEKVKKLVEQNSIITGGSIASMLIGEKVNDFDIYFINKETVLAVADYYLKEFLSVRKTSEEEGVEVPIELIDWDSTGNTSILYKIETMKEKGMPEDFYKGRVSYYIKSAGLASQEEENPYQYFEGASPELAAEFVEDVTNIDKPEEGKYRPVFLSGNAISLTDKVQLIIRFYGEPDKIHENYDFAHCRSYWTSKDRELVTPPEAMTALLSKELTYVGSRYPLTSVIRTKKFLLRGWKIHAGNYLKMCMQISSIDLYNPVVLEEQLIGVDIAYFMQVINAISKAMEDDPSFKLEYTYIATILERIFDK